MQIQNRLTITYSNTNTKYFSAILVNTKYKYFNNVFKYISKYFETTFPINKKHLNHSEFWKSEHTTRYSFSSTIKIWKKVKINTVPDTALLFRAAALFSVICYPLRGTNVFKIQNTNTCCKKYLNTNTKYIKINVCKIQNTSQICISLTYIRKKSSPSEEPWGTPQSIISLL